ncbi:MAG: hypothetical protein ACLR6J_15370 [Parabacteroides merdae]
MTVISVLGSMPEIYLRDGPLMEACQVRTMKGGAARGDRGQCARCQCSSQRTQTSLRRAPIGHDLLYHLPLRT